MMTLISAKVCMHISYKLHMKQYLQEKQQSPKSNIPLSSFRFLPSFLSPPSLWQQAWSHLANPTTNTHGHSASAYTVSELQKTSCCGSGSAFSEALVPLCLQMQLQGWKFSTILVSSTGKLFIEGCTVKEDFHGKGGTFISCLAKPDLNLAGEQLGGGERGKMKKKKRWSHKGGEREEKAVFAPVN